MKAVFNQLLAILIFLLILVVSIAVIVKIRDSTNQLNNLSNQTSKLTELERCIDPSQTCYSYEKSNNYNQVCVNKTLCEINEDKLQLFYLEKNNVFDIWLDRYERPIIKTDQNIISIKTIDFDPNDKRFYFELNAEKNDQDASCTLNKQENLWTLIITGSCKINMILKSNSTNKTLITKEFFAYKE